MPEAEKYTINDSLLFKSFHVRCGNSLQVAVHVKQLLVELVLRLLYVVSTVQLITQPPAASCKVSEILPSGL